MNAIELTRQRVRFDTRNPPGDEGACARFRTDMASYTDITLLVPG